MKPSMKVYEIARKPQMLVGSDPNSYPGNFNYIPGQQPDEKQLA